MATKLSVAITSLVLLYGGCLFAMPSSIARVVFEHCCFFFFYIGTNSKEFEVEREDSVYSAYTVSAGGRCRCSGTRP